MVLYANRYEQIKSLGHGATGSVELVTDTKTGVQCALKMLRTTRGGGQSSSLEGFQKEFEILKEINHPSVAKVYDAGFDDEEERFYIATEFVSGSDLYKATENASFYVIEDLFVQSLRALNYLHSKEIYHLDIKPQNLLVSVNEDNKFTVKIIDFGFANFFERNSAKKKQNEDVDNVLIIGTPAYTAPEIINGEPHDGRTDLYSLACVFYEALTRKLPFRSESRDPREVHHKHLTDIPQTLTEINPDIPAYLNEVILKMLKKAPEDRFVDAGSVIKEINLSTPIEHEIETPETRMSYLLEQGTLVGRDDELAKFLEHYKDRITFEFHEKNPFLIIAGEEGSGKTRFLQECKNAVQKDFTRTISWSEFIKTLPEDLVTPCLVIGDDVLIEKKYLFKVKHGYEDESVLVILTTNQKEIPAEEDNVIRLHNFNKEQVVEYLNKTTGLKKIPDRIIETLYQYTDHGKPLYLIHFLRAAFKNNYLIDSHGRWSEKIFEDLVMDLKTLGFTAFIKKDLMNKLESVEIEEPDYDLLYTMALTNKPTLTDIRELTCGYLIEKKLEYFVEKGILTTDPEIRYVFSNPLYKEIILEKMPRELKEEYCDKIADHLEMQNPNDDQIMYFRGRGGKRESAQMLLLYAKQKRKELYLDKAIENLLEITKKEKVDKQILNTSLLELGEIYIEKGMYEESDSYLLQITELKTEDKITPVVIKAYEQLGISNCRRKKYDESSKYYQKGLNLIKDRPDMAWLAAGLTNRLSINEMEKGNVEEAERLSQEAWILWDKTLNKKDSEKASIGESDIIYFAKGEYQKAIQSLEDQLASLSEKSYMEDYPRTLYRLAIINIKIGKIDEGEKYLNQCIDLVKERKTPNWLYGVYNELGVLSEKKRDYQKAAENYQHAFSLAEKTASGEINVFVIASNLARTFVAQDKLEEAQKHFNYIVSNIKKLGRDNDVSVNNILVVSYIELSEIFRNQRKYDQCEISLEEAKKLIDKKEHLKHYLQYYWQERASVNKAQDKQEAFEKDFSELNKIKTEKWFNVNDFESWKKKTDK